MQLIVLGLNHKTAPVEVREGFNFSADRIARILLQPHRVLYGAGRTRQRHEVHPDFG